MNYFDKDFWKYSFQFVLIIFLVLITITVISGYINGSGVEANLNLTE